MVPAQRRHWSTSFTSARRSTTFQSQPGKPPSTSVIQLYLPTAYYLTRNYSWTLPSTTHVSQAGLEQKNSMRRHYRKRVIRREISASCLSSIAVKSQTAYYTRLPLIHFISAKREHFTNKPTTWTPNPTFLKLSSFEFEWHSNSHQ